MLLLKYSFRTYYSLIDLPNIDIVYNGQEEEYLASYSFGLVRILLSNFLKLKAEKLLVSIYLLL